MQLPALVFMSDYDEFVDYFEAIYAIFKRDFVDSKPTFEGKVLRLKSYPFIDGKEYTFYHFTHSGNDESGRLPDLRRMERIAWPRPFIDYSNDSSLKVWKNKRGTRTRVLIFHEVENYLVILEERENYILPWTGYLVEYSNRKEKLLREYEEYLKTKTA